jgi:hypothetical protein
MEIPGTTQVFAVILREQPGLRLVPAKGPSKFSLSTVRNAHPGTDSGSLPVAVIVAEHAERPVAN